MPTLSQGAHIAWQLAAGEALRSGHQHIENADVFIGLCKLGTWLRSMKQRGKLVAQRAKLICGLCMPKQRQWKKPCGRLPCLPIILGNTVRAVVEKGTSRSS